MDPYCACRSAPCLCKGKCSCVPRVCTCIICVEDRNTRNCRDHYSIDNRTKESPEEAAPNSGLASAAAPKSVLKICIRQVRLYKLPDLNQTSTQRQSSGATGYSSSSITVSKKNDPPQAHCLSSSDSSPNETSRRLKVPTHAKSTKYSPSKSPKSREPSPPRVFSVSKSTPSSVSPKKSPNCLSKSDTQISDCPRSFPDSDSQSAEQIPPEIKTQSPCINDNDLHSNSADKPSDDEVEPDQQESSK